MLDRPRPRPRGRRILTTRLLCNKTSIPPLATRTPMSRCPFAFGKFATFGVFRVSFPVVLVLTLNFHVTNATDLTQTYFNRPPPLSSIVSRSIRTYLGQSGYCGGFDDDKSDDASACQCRPVAARPALVWRLTRSVHPGAASARDRHRLSPVLSRCAAAGPEPRCPERFSHGARPPVYTRTSTTPVPLGCRCLSSPTDVPLRQSACEAESTYRQSACDRCTYPPRSACNQCTYPPRSACEAERTCHAPA